MSKDPKTPIERINWTVGSEDSETLRERYNVWAKTYDGDIMNAEDYRAPQRTVDRVVDAVEREARSLDAGCGTGLVGEALWAAGYRHIEGLDFSPGMLDVAKTKGTYAALHEADLNKALSLPSEQFDAVIMVGTTLHVDGSCFAEFSRILKPGGWLFFCGWDRLFEEAGFAAAAEALADRGKLALIEISDMFKPLPKSEPQIDYCVYVFRTPN